MAKWKDKTKLEDSNEVIGSEIQLGEFRLEIHHYIGCGEDWFISCGHICHPMDGKDIAFLKTQALIKFELLLNEAKEDIPNSGK